MDAILEEHYVPAKRLIDNYIDALVDNDAEEWALISTRMDLEFYLSEYPSSSVQSMFDLYYSEVTAAKLNAEHSLLYCQLSQSQLTEEAKSLTKDFSLLLPILWLKHGRWWRKAATISTRAEELIAEGERHTAEYDRYAQRAEVVMDIRSQF